MFDKSRHFLHLRNRPLNDWLLFAYCAGATLFSVSLPIRVWGSFRAERQLETQHARLTEARLAALTNQINPHFLFNTLNSIATLIRINPESARNMIYRLSKILRRLLRKTENYSPLREEIAFIDDYLAIEMVRFGEKLKFEKQIEPATLSRLVPSMILQPIIENSIRHGLANKVEGGTVRLRTWLDGTRLNISMEDDGVGISRGKTRKPLRIRYRRQQCERTVTCFIRRWLPHRRRQQTGPRHQNSHRNPRSRKYRRGLAFDRSFSPLSETFYFSPASSPHLALYGSSAISVFTLKPQNRFVLACRHSVDRRSSSQQQRRQTQAHRLYTWGRRQTAKGDPLC